MMTPLIGQVHSGQQSSPKIQHALSKPGDQGKQQDTQNGPDSFQTVFSRDSKTSDKQTATLRSDQNEGPVDDGTPAADDAVSESQDKRDENAETDNASEAESTDNGLQQNIETGEFSVRKNAPSATIQGDEGFKNDSHEVTLPANSSNLHERNPGSSQSAQIASDPTGASTTVLATNSGETIHTRKGLQASTATNVESQSTLSTQNTPSSKELVSNGGMQQATTLAKPTTEPNPIASDKSGQGSVDQIMEDRLKAAPSATPTTGRAHTNETQATLPGIINATKAEIDRSTRLSKMVDGTESDDLQKHQKKTELAGPIHTIKTAQTVPASHSSSASPAHNPAAVGLIRDQLDSTGQAKWTSEVGFSADIAAGEMPATLRAQQTIMAPPPDLPRHVMAQVAEAIRQGGTDRPLELTLNPAELGRVRISMQGTEGAMTVHVIADRPETLELMRRHIDLLAQDFLDMGFDSTEFAFGQSTSDPKGDTEQNASSSLHAHDTAVDQISQSAASPTLAIQTDRIDIRI